MGGYTVLGSIVGSDYCAPPSWYIMAKRGLDVPKTLASMQVVDTLKWSTPPANEVSTAAP